MDIREYRYREREKNVAYAKAERNKRDDVAERSCVGIPALYARAGYFRLSFRERPSRRGFRKETGA